VVLEVGESSARIGIEDVAEDEDGHFIPAEDVTWARPVDEDGNAGDQARVAGDLLSVGDVVHVRAMTRDSDGSFMRWTLRQIPEVQGGFMAMDVNTGRVLAMQGGFSYQHSSFNRATQATRQPGSSFKPFVYAAALDSGYGPNTIVIDAPIEVATPEGMWRPTNASNQFYGPAPLRTGIERSRNLMTVRLAQDVGMDVVARYAERFGVYDDMQPFLANALGSQETTLYRMVAAYAMFANGGERVEPTLVDRIQDRYGRTVYRHDQRLCPDCELASLDPGMGPRIVSNRKRVIDPVTAYQLTSMMQGVVQRGTAAGTVGARGHPAGSPARPAPRTTRATCGSWASPRPSWRAATSATTSPAASGAAPRAAACAARSSPSSCARRCRNTAARPSRCRRAACSTRSTAIRASACRPAARANTWSTSCSARARRRSRGSWR
jgi:penicillin-binding protein 1A